MYCVKVSKGQNDETTNDEMLNVNNEIKSTLPPLYLTRRLDSFKDVHFSIIQHTEIFNIYPTLVLKHVLYDTD